MIFKGNALFLWGVLYSFSFLHKLVNNGKNVDSANLCMVFSVSLVFCLATIGVGVFRCVASVTHLFYMLIGGYMSKNIQKRVIDITGIELMPGEPNVCLGNGEQGFECCCDECDYCLFCFPELDKKTK